MAVALGSISTLYLLRLFSNKTAHTLQFLFWVVFFLFFKQAPSLPGSFKISLLFSVHALLRTKQPESSQRQKPHKPLPTPLDNPKIRYIPASQKQEWMGQCFPAWQDPKKHLEHLLKHRMPASWPGDCFSRSVHTGAMLVQMDLARCSAGHIPRSEMNQRASQVAQW